MTHYSDIEKHRTGVSASTSDFVKHECPRKIEAWENGQKVEKSIQVKAEFNRIRGNENMVPINCRASDKCGYCGANTDGMTPCTDEDVEALSK